MRKQKQKKKKEEKRKGNLKSQENKSNVRKQM